MEFTDRYLTDKEVKVRGDAVYQNYFGEALVFTYNGRVVKLNLDGTEQVFPEFIANEINRRLREIVLVNMPVKRNDLLREL